METPTTPTTETETEETMEIPTVTVTPKTKKGRPRKEPEEKVSKSEEAVFDEMRGEEAQNLKDFLSVLGSGGDEFKLKIKREQPRSWKGKSIEGFVAEFSEPVEESFIKEMYGGGTYILEVHRRKGRNWVYFRRRTIKIAGDPIVRDEEEEANKAANGHASSIDDSLRLAKYLSEGSSRESRESTQMFQMMNDSLRLQIEEVNRRNDALMAELRDLRHSRGDTTYQDRLLEKVVTSSGSQFESIREVHASEMRTMRELQRAELDELRRASREDIQRVHEQHQREIEHLRDSHKDAKKTLEQAFETRIESLRSDRDRLMSDLTEARSKIAALEAKKDKSLIEQMGEITALKDAFKEFGGGDDEGPKKWYESFADNAPAMLETVMERLRPEQAPAPQQNQLQAPQPNPIDAQARASAAALGIEIPPDADLPPVGHPFRMADGNVYVRSSAIEFRALTAEEIQEAEREARAPSQEHVQMAVRFLEQAASNNQDPVTFAQGIRSFIPGDTVDWILSEGVDNLLSRAKLEQNSVLRAQKGRNFARAAIEALRGD